MCSISVEPMPSSSSAPVRSVQRRPISGGKASPAEVQTRSASCSFLGKFGDASKIKPALEKYGSVEVFDSNGAPLAAAETP